PRQTHGTTSERLNASDSRGQRRRMTRILGIDPGLQITGYAILEVTPDRPRICEAGIIKSSEGRRTTDPAPRLVSLYDGIGEIVEQFQPQVMAVEQLYSHYAHPRTAILMAH